MSDMKAAEKLLDELDSWLSTTRDYARGVMDSLEDLNAQLSSLEDMCEEWNEIVYGE